MQLQNKMIGGLLLVVGTTIGGGMLALPVALSGGGFYHSLFLLAFCWLLMTYSALLILEINLWFPESSNMISMSRSTLGEGGAAFTWVCYLFLLYCLLAAYISGGADLCHYLFSKLQIDVPISVCAVLFTFIMSIIVVQGIHSVDFVNRGLMFFKLGVYLALACLITPYVDDRLLQAHQPRLLLPAVTLVVSSFSFANIIPSLRTYFKDEAPMLFKVILWGSLIPLFCYTAWNYVILGTIPHEGANGLNQMLHTGHEVSSLTQSLSARVSHASVTILMHSFTSICVLTAFLAVSLGLSDFIADGLSVQKNSQGQRLKVYGSTFIPPLLINLIYPQAFVYGLSFGGLFCVILQAFLPAIMAWRGRYQQGLRQPQHHTVPGGKVSLLLVMLICTGILILGITEIIH